MSETLTELAKKYFVKKVGGATQDESLNSVKRRYWLGLFGGDRNTGFNDLEKQWLRKIIVDNGSSPVSKYTNDLWREAVVALGGPSTKCLSDNQKQVYILDF